MPQLLLLTQKYEDLAKVLLAAFAATGEVDAHRRELTARAVWPASMEECRVLAQVARVNVLALNRRPHEPPQTSQTADGRVMTLLIEHVQDHSLPHAGVASLTG